MTRDLLILLELAACTGGALLGVAISLAIIYWPKK
jgi:hypothetical protein